MDLIKSVLHLSPSCRHQSVWSKLPIQSSYSSHDMNSPFILHIILTAYSFSTWSELSIISSQDLNCPFIIHIIPSQLCIFTPFGLHIILALQLPFTWSELPINTSHDKWPVHSFVTWLNSFPSALSEAYFLRINSSHHQHLVHPFILHSVFTTVNCSSHALHS